MISENAANLATSDNVPERLRAFMLAHDLSLQELAGLLRTTPETLEQWFDGDPAPPACLLALMVLMQTIPQGWPAAGASPPYSYSSDKSLSVRNCSAKEEMLKRVRAI
ncbi:MAG: helix-turn-helix transcriptional regulator [Rhodomicrobium sp.]